MSIPWVGTPLFQVVALWSVLAAPLVALGAPSGLGMPAGSTLTPTQTAGSRTITLAPEADATVDANAPVQNRGTNPVLEVDGKSGSSGLPVKAFLRFSVPQLSGAVSSATLRLYVVNGSLAGPALHATSSAWDELSLTWDTRPAMGAMLGDAGTVALGTWLEYDVTATVAGGGVYAFGLSQSGPDGTDFSSREGAYPPELVITSPAAPLAPVTGYRLVFSDEFEGAEVDRSKWETKMPWGRSLGNGSEMLFMDDDVLVYDGALHLRAQKREVTDGTKTAQYSSGVVTSYNSFNTAYGFFEARVRIPVGQGLWPAFWVYPYPSGWSPEIDFAEWLGHNPRKIYLTYHYADQDGDFSTDGSSFAGPDFSVDWHVIGCEWTPEAITWYVDGVERFRLQHDIKSEPVYVIANLAVGGNWPGSPDPTTPFPSYYDVDYIRVWQR